MRKYSVLAAVAAVIPLCIACTEQPNSEQSVSKPDSVYMYNLSTNGAETLQQITYYTYDAAKNATSIVDSYTSETVSIDIEKTEMHYNTKGQMISRKRAVHYKQEDSWEEREYQTYTYDTNDKLNTSYLYIPFTDPLPDLPDRKIIYTWIDDTHSEHLVYDYKKSQDGISEVLSQKIETAYTYFGEIEKQVLYWMYGMEETEEGLLGFSYELTYDKHGNVVYITKYDKGNFVSKQYNQYEYDAKGNILVRWYCSNTNGEDTGIFNFKYEYFY